MTDQITIPGRHWIARYYPKLLQLSFSVFKWALISLPVMFLLVSLLDGRICQDSSCLALLALFVPTLSARNLFMRFNFDLRRVLILTGFSRDYRAIRLELFRMVVGQDGQCCTVCRCHLHARFPSDLYHTF